MSESNIDYSILPEHMREGMRRYVKDGIEPGSFLYLILCNDFVHAAGHADYINQERLMDYARFLYLELPLGLWGSRKKIENWIKMKHDIRNLNLMSAEDKEKINEADDDHNI